jgi:hypothetical protein
MKEYKIIKPTSMWSYKDSTFEDLFNQHALQGWNVISVGYGSTSNITKAVLERDKNR